MASLYKLQNGFLSCNTDLTARQTYLPCFNVLLLYVEAEIRNRHYTDKNKHNTAIAKTAIIRDRVHKSDWFLMHLFVTL